MDKKETTTITFRIDEENSQALRKVAEEREISLNTLANQIFGSTLQLDYPMSKFGVVMMSKLAFKTLLTNLNDKDIIKLGSEIGGSKSLKNLFYSNGIKSIPRLFSIW